MIGDLINDVPAGKDRWLLSYVDLLTLLLAFFVVMYSVSVVNKTKLHDVSASIGEALNSSGIAEPQFGEAVAEALMMDSKSIESVVSELSLPDIQVTLNNSNWVDFTLDSEIFFASGNAQIRDDANIALGNMLQILAGTKGEIHVEGHTDNRPIATDRFPSNWELSAARAASVVRFLEESGITGTRLAALGLGETLPVDDNTTEAGRTRNRRVIFKVEKSGVDFDRLKRLNLVKQETRNHENIVEATADPIIVPEPREPKDDDAIGDLDNIDPALLRQILRELENEG